MTDFQNSYGRLARFYRTLAMSLALISSGMALAAAAGETVPDKNGKLANKVALITGAGSGMGREIALLFAKEGAAVVVADIDGISAGKTAETIRNARRQALAVTADVAREQDVSRMVDTTVSTYGRLDILVNNAGIFDMLVPAGEVTDELWDRVIATNLTGPMRVIRKTLPVFEKQNGGVIVNTASIAGYTGARGGGAAYIASKHGVIGLTKNVAFNYKDKNIRCNAVAPGRVETGIRANSEKLAGAQTLHDATVSRWKDIENAVTAGYVTNRRKASPDEIAKAVLFLASDDASFVNGSILTVDGAWTAY